MITPTPTLFRSLATTAKCFRPAATRVSALSATRRNASTGGGNILSDKNTQQGTSTTSGKETGGSRDHALDKGNDGDSNIQSQTSKAGRDAHNSDKGGSATEGKDTRNATEQAKKDHPEAPDVVIGMQDERGGKGA